MSKQAPKATKLTPAMVAAAVNKIYECRDDDEAAHVREDNLYARVLQAIADSECDDPAQCAQNALMTKSINFARWCA